MENIITKEDIKARETKEGEVMAERGSESSHLERNVLKNDIEGLEKEGALEKRMKPRGRKNKEVESFDKKVNVC